MVENDESADLFFDDLEKNSLSDEQILACRKKILHFNQYKLVKIQRRNIILCGKSRSGKTTAMSVLKNPCATPCEMKIFADTINPEYYSFSIQDSTTSSVRKYSLSIMDTPGFFELRPNGVGPRPEEMLVGMIRKCLDVEITNLHNAFVFVNVGETFNKDDFRTLEQYLKLFSGGNLRMALVITHSDNHDLKWRKRLVDQIKEVEFFQNKLTDDPYRYCDLKITKTLDRELQELRLKEEAEENLKKELEPTNNTSTPTGKEEEENSSKKVAEEEEEEEEDYGESKLDILFMGCVDPSTKETEEGLLAEYKKVYLMRKIFLQYVFLSNHRVQLRNLEMLKGRKTLVLSFLGKIVKSFQEFKLETDYDNCQDKLMNHVDMMRKIPGYEKFYALPGIHEKFTELTNTARETVKTLRPHWVKESSQESRIQQFVWPLTIESVALQKKE